MDTLIANASSTFANAVGFNLSDVVDFVFEQSLVVLGFGLYIFKTNLPIILVFGAITAVVGLLYALYRWTHIGR